ncbi:hypothetical protein HPP92_006738 [Vanilla planifolia]|uniref:DEK-C domain-containing protein n=1 Tax=Vanilla planifolia TaxID=51239 RepID=A0A835RCR5_VANPL|nr:hypothetical protein HPP92_006994 [Vanilla planifolia]KAG0489875.1 hypothetical protein HPP92_006738 [Vanilla planifolia]
MSGEAFEAREAINFSEYDERNLYENRSPRSNWFAFPRNSLAESEIAEVAWRSMASKSSDEEVRNQTPQKRGVKRKREEEETPATTLASPNRPSRERKPVERYGSDVAQRTATAKSPTIQRVGFIFLFLEEESGFCSGGFGDASFYLFGCFRVLGKSSRKFRTVHCLKRNILQFSGFVWSQNETKGKSKVKESLNKCNKDRLMEFCDLLDLYTVKRKTKKEEIVAKVLEFLESPTVTRELVLSKRSKRFDQDGKGTGQWELGETSSGRAKKRQKRNDDEEEGKAKNECRKLAKPDGKDEEGKNNEESASKVTKSGERIVSRGEAKSKDKKKCQKAAKTHEDDEEEGNTEDGSAVVENNGSEKIFAKDMPKRKAKKNCQKIAKTDQEKGGKDNDGSDSEETRKSEPKVKIKKGRQKAAKTNKEVEKEAKTKDKSSLEEIRRSERILAKGKTKKVHQKAVKIHEDKGNNNDGNATEEKRSAKAVTKGKGKEISDEPSTEQLHFAISEIVKEVDFNVATVRDVILHLGARFSTNLMHRKGEIQKIVNDVISNMTDDEDDEDAE